MTPADIDRVFGRGRLRMVTGEHVEVYREESAPGERRRYTKRFLATAAGDFRPWTEREWRILARLVGHGIGPVPDVVQFDRGAAGRPALVQTYDAGVTVDHWATLLPVEHDGGVLRHVFEDCAHWWALARHCLIALDEPARMVGNGAIAGANVALHDLACGDMLVLCSDGVHKHLDARDISRLLRRGGLPLARRCTRLLVLARARGSTDDATVLVIHRAAVAPRSPVAA